MGWLDPVHPEDRNAALMNWSKAVETGGFEVEYRIRHAGTNAYRWFHTRATPVRDTRGVIIEWLGTSTDVEDLRSLQARQEALVNSTKSREPDRVSDMISGWAFIHSVSFAEKRTQCTT